MSAYYSENTLSESTAVVSSTDGFLNMLIMEQRRVNVFLTSGIKLQGHLIADGDNCLILKGFTHSDHSISQLIYKHSISTVMPAIAVD